MVFDNKHLLEGSVTKSLFKLSWPIILANLLQTAYNLTDTFWVGRLGSNAVASVSISFPIIFLLISIGSGLALAGTILVSQYKGGKDQKNVDHVSTQTIILIGFISILISFLGYMLSPFLLGIMGAETAVYNDAVSYLRISFIGMIFLFMFGVFQSLLRGVGDAKTPLYVIFFSVILNLILDPLFIFGFGIIPPMGVVGAAFATIGIYLLLSGKHSIHIKPNDFKPDFKLMKRMFFLGLPASIEQSMRALGMTVMTILVTSFGTITVASYGIGTRILSFIIIPAIGISIATSTLVGQNIGAGKPKRAKQITKISSELSFIILTIVGIILFIFSNQIKLSFHKDNGTYIWFYRIPTGTTGCI
jgi:putative MATE family efflux protein